MMGDDHTYESSTTCHQSAFALIDAMVPILNAGVQEVLDYGLYGWELSRGRAFNGGPEHRFRESYGYHRRSPWVASRPRLCEKSAN